jgi:L-seryl-tRNA(Ser) seleniumtransferase
MSASIYRQIPSVAAVLESAAIVALRDRYLPNQIADAVRLVLAGLRSTLAAGQVASFDLEAIARSVSDRLQSDDAVRLRPVINATGIVLHTNLGRSRLSDAASQAALDAGRSTLNLELDLNSGKRSHRAVSIRDDLCRLTGAESGTVVNNCAAATMIVLRALAFGNEVIVSRGQLVEIGGSFRIPEIMATSGATLREVGTTNITRIADYERAIGPNTGLIIRVHPSNYRIHGFTESVDLPELVKLGRKHGIPVVDDIGSGLAIDLTPFGFPAEPTVADGIRAGADLVLFSGDKLLGGPQAGLIAGRADLVKRVEADPLMRAIRPDKMTLAALAETLRAYREPGRALREIPTLRMLTAQVPELEQRAGLLMECLQANPRLLLEIVPDQTYAGGGSLPDHAIPTVTVVVTAEGLSEDEFARKLRLGTPSVMARTNRGRLIFDMRTVEADQIDALVAAIMTATAS